MPWALAVGLSHALTLPFGLITEQLLHMPKYGDLSYKVSTFPNDRVDMYFWST